MNKNLILSSLFLLLSLLCHAQEQKQLTIIHTNDMHSCVLPRSPYLQDSLLAGRGGMARLVTLLKEEREKDSDLLVFDSGDFSQNSSFYTYFHGDVEIELMNMMGVTASTLGNHEWDFGIDNLARIIKMADFPFLCANYDVTGTVLEGLIKPYMVLERKGIRIGVFGLCPLLDGLVRREDYASVVAHDPLPMAEEVATMLRKEKQCDVVICISHLGRDENGSDTEMIPQSRNIDIVLQGHSHTFLPELEYVNDMDGNQVAVDQNGHSAIYVGKIVLTVKN